MINTLYCTKRIMKKSYSKNDLINANSRSKLIAIAKEKNIALDKTLNTLSYEKELVYLQLQLLKLQQWISDNNKRVAIIFEGRDASGKGGTIRRFTEHLNPRSMNIVALDKPTEVERGQWYFRRYIKRLPNPGEMVFFDRSWYNRAVVEPVMGFCNNEQYNIFMRQAPEFEHMLFEDNIVIIKFWFSVDKKQQSKRFKSRMNNPLKQWKLSPVDIEAQGKWDEFSHYKEEMFSKTHTSFSPWIIVNSNNKKKARLESIRYVLSQFDFNKGNHDSSIYPDPNIVRRYHRSIKQQD